MLIPFAELWKRHGIRSEGVLHLGAHTGEEAADYARQGIKRAIWVEALQLLIPKLTQHVQSFSSMSSLVFQACLSDVTGQSVDFNISNNMGMSSSMMQFGTHAQEHPTVKFVDVQTMVTTRADQLLADVPMGPGWFLNIDLQGAELLAIRGLGARLRDFDHAYLEVNQRELYLGCPLVGEINSFMLANGFRGMEEKWTGAGWGDRYFKRINGGLINIPAHFAGETAA